MLISVKNQFSKMEMNNELIFVLQWHSRTNVLQPLSQFECRERRLVLKRYVKTNQPQPNADHFDIGANVEMDVDMEEYVLVTTACIRNIVSSK